MCYFELISKTGLTRFGQGMEGTLHFLGSLVILLSLLRLGVFWLLGV